MKIIYGGHGNNLMGLESDSMNLNSVLNSQTKPVSIERRLNLKTLNTIPSGTNHI